MNEALQSVATNNATGGSVAPGVFKLLETFIDGVESLNPERPARRNIFLSEAVNGPERARLLRRLNQWEALLQTDLPVQELIQKSAQQADHCRQLLEANQAEAIAQCRPLESAYRNVALFFQNAGSERIRNLSFFNCDPRQARDLDDPRFIDHVQEELTMNYDRLDLRNNYSLLIVPGYLGGNAVLDKWAKIAHANKVMMLTDFEPVESPDDVMELFEAAGHTSGEVFKSNVMMTCNWLVGRGRYDALDEEEDLHVPPSGALAGRIYRTLMSQVTAGKKFGVLQEVAGVQFELKKSEVANLEKMGLVPMVKEGGKVMAFSAKTLFNGDNLGLQTYSVVRVFDYVTKVLIDFLNRRAFENFNANTRKDLMNEIVQFLDGVTGPDKLIEDFTIRRFEQDPRQKDRIHLDIHMKPYFPAKNFMIKMEGQKGVDSMEWGTGYLQD